MAFPGAWETGWLTERTALQIHQLGRRGPRAQGCGPVAEAGESKPGRSPESLEGAGLADTLILGPVRPILDFRSPEPKDEFVLSSAAKFVVIGCMSIENIYMYTGPLEINRLIQLNLERSLRLPRGNAMKLRPEMMSASFQRKSSRKRNSC